MCLCLCGEHSYTSLLFCLGSSHAGIALRDAQSPSKTGTQLSVTAIACPTLPPAAPGRSLGHSRSTACICLEIWASRQVRATEKQRGSWEGTLAFPPRNITWLTRAIALQTLISKHKGDVQNAYLRMPSVPCNRVAMET